MFAYAVGTAVFFVVLGFAKLGTIMWKDHQAKVRNEARALFAGRRREAVGPRLTEEGRREARDWTGHGV